MMAHESAERAQRLALVQSDGEPPGVGGWKWRLIGREVQIRSRRLPHLRLDLTVSEASDLERTLTIALDESFLRPVIKISLWGRLVDWLARRTWRRKHAEEQALALEVLAKEFRERGGW